MARQGGTPMYRHVAIALLLVAGPTAASVVHADEFKLLMWIEGVSGPESQTRSWIEASNFVHQIPNMPTRLQLMDRFPPHFSVEYQPTANATGLARGARITKRLDKTSPLLARCCRQGTAIPRMKLALVSPVRKQAIGMNFEEIKVTACTMRAPGFGDRAGVTPVSADQALEEIEITFGKVTAAIESYPR
ncbi:MAG: hypothetical protein GF393_08830 [Armatimonadia bacterium]|nr:hypothetical protein [Armatimonadia bacterium]